MAVALGSCRPAPGQHAGTEDAGGRAAAPAKTAAPAKPVAVPNGVLDLVAAPDGSARFVPAGEPLVVRRLDPAGLIGPPHHLIADPGAREYGMVALTSGGGAVATYGQVERKVTLRVVERSADGAVSAPQTLSEPRLRIGAPSIDVGPTGAVAVAFDEEPGNNTYLPRLAFKPAHASRFLPSIKLKPDSDHSNTDLEPVLGPDGGGVLLGLNGTQRESFVERLSAAGAIGPAIPIHTGLAGATFGSAVFAPDGTLAVVLSVDGSNGGPDTASHTGVYIATLALGTATIDRAVALRGGAVAFSYTQYADAADTGSSYVAVGMP